MKQEADDAEVESDRTTLESATTLLHPPPTAPSPFIKAEHTELHGMQSKS